MFRFAWIFFIYFALLFNTQAELDITFYDAEIVFYDPHYFKDIEIYLLDDNKLFANVTIINYLPRDAILHISLIAATMGEYIIPTGFIIEFPLCEILKDPILAVPVITAFKFSPDVCPPDPGVYTLDGFESDFSLYPETFPPNNYLTKSEIYTEKELLLELRTYQRIV